MKVGQLVKNVNSGRIVRIKNIDQIGINMEKIGTHGAKYDMFLESIRPLTLLETIDYKLNRIWDLWRKD